MATLAPAGGERSFPLTCASKDFCGHTCLGDTTWYDAGSFLPHQGPAIITVIIFPFCTEKERGVALK